MLISLIVAAPESSLEEMRSALEYQYEQSQVKLHSEIAKLKQQLAKQTQALQLCRESAPLETTKAKKLNQNSLDDSKKTAGPADSEIFVNAMSELQSKKYDDAILSFESLVQQHPESDLADNAILMMAEIYQFRGERQLAIAELERLMQLYPKSERIAQAQERIQKLQVKETGAP